MRWKPVLLPEKSVEADIVSIACFYRMALLFLSVGLCIIGCLTGG
jgi:hypothetical protein